MSDDLERAYRLGERFTESLKGGKPHTAFLKHRDEVVHLVNHCRPVTVAWHRGKGPAYLANLLENARNPTHRIPFTIEGVPRRELISRMAEVLMQAGTPALKTAITAHREEVLALIDDFDDLHELVKRFEETPVNA